MRPWKSHLDTLKDFMVPGLPRLFSRDFKESVNQMLTEWRRARGLETFICALVLQWQQRIRAGKCRKLLDWSSWQTSTWHYFTCPKLEKQKKKYVKDGLKSSLLWVQNWLIVPQNKIRLLSSFMLLFISCLFSCCHFTHLPPLPVRWSCF